MAEIAWTSEALRWLERILLHGNYRIAYLIKRDENVDILGVFHSALDIKKYQL